MLNVRSTATQRITYKSAIIHPTAGFCGLTPLDALIKHTSAHLCSTLTKRGPPGLMQDIGFGVGKHTTSRLACEAPRRRCWLVQDVELFGGEREVWGLWHHVPARGVITKWVSDMKLEVGYFHSCCDRWVSVNLLLECSNSGERGSLDPKPPMPSHIDCIDTFTQCRWITWQSSAFHFIWPQRLGTSHGTFISPRSPTKCKRPCDFYNRGK